MFVAIEGPDFAGKTTIVKALAAAWSAAFDCHASRLVTAREPGGTPLGERLRSMLFEERRARTTELCLFSAARCELVEKVIMPAIKAGQDVILDRYWWSTVVYQGERLWPDDPHKAVLSIQSLADSLRWPPAFTVLVSTPPEVIMHRMKTRKDQEQTVFDPATVSTVYSQIKLYDLCYRATPSDRTLQVSGEDEALSITVELIIKELKNRFP